MPPDAAYRQGGKARPAPSSRETYTPKEFAAALADHGLSCSEKWVLRQCRAGKLATFPVFGRWYIIRSELFRLLGVEDEA